MKHLPEREPALSPSESALSSVRAVIARATDVLWQADAAGVVTGVTSCRPAHSERAGELDETEVAQVEQLWRKAIRCAERFSAVYHVRTPGSATQRNFLVQAVPVFDSRDEVLYWSGHSTEVERFADSGTRFISEATAVLASSLNRATIVNRFVQVALGDFCDLCAVHTFDDDGAIHLEGLADRRPDLAMPPQALEPPIREAVRTQQPLLFLAAVREPGGEKIADLVRASRMRSLIVVPLLAGSTCIGTLTFLESECRASFAARELDIAVVVARQLALALANIKTFEREQHVTERYRFLARITERLFATLDPAKTLTLLLDGIVERLADYAIAASLCDDRLRIVAESGTSESFREGSELELVNALRERRSILKGATSDVSLGARLKEGPLDEAGRPLSWMMVPIASNDSIYGSIVCCSNTRHYDITDLELLEEIGRRASIALEHAQSFIRERKLVQTLQSATLPAQLAGVEGASLSAIYRPAASEVQVGGDWYDAYDLDDGRVLLSVGDVTGHGLEASSVMGKLRHSINVVAMYERDPARILDAAERILLRRYPGAVATAFVAIVDSASHTMSYANAGHPYPLLRRRDGSIHELQAEGLPLGLRGVGPAGTPHTESLDDAALLVLYTDGLTEATRDMVAGETLLREAIGTEAVAFVESPAQFVESYCLRGHAPDDVAILALNFVRSQRWAFEGHDRQAARTARRDFAEQLKSRGVSEKDVPACEHIFAELTAGVARHAEGPLEVALDCGNGDAVLHVIGRGTGYPAARSESGVTVENLPGFGVHVQAVLPVRAGFTDPSFFNGILRP